MDKKVLRERIRKKQQQMRRRKMMRLGAYVIAVILVVIFVIRGILIPVVNRIGGKSVDKPAQVQAETDQTNVDSDTVSDGNRQHGGYNDDISSQFSGNISTQESSGKGIADVYWME